MRSTFLKYHLYLTQCRRTSMQGWIALEHHPNPKDFSCVLFCLFLFENAFLILMHGPVISLPFLYTSIYTPLLTELFLKTAFQVYYLVHYPLLDISATFIEIYQYFNRKTKAIRGTSLSISTRTLRGKGLTAFACINLTVPCRYIVKTLIPINYM